MKGSLDTYWEKEGNDYDLASLLIALLRASNIPARYVRAKIIVPVEQIQALTGINDAMTAVKYLGSSKIVLGYYTTGGKISHVYLEHVYVEANVPYANYRGTMEDTAGKIWIQLDPSFKQYQTVQDGIDLATDMGFDWKTFSNQYIGDLRTNTPMEYYKEQMDAFIAGKYPGQTLDNLKHIAAIKTMQFDFLPNTVPYNIIELIERTSQLAAAQRHTIRFNIPDCLDYQTTLPDIAGRRVTLSYIGATADDQTLIDQYGGIYKTPPYLISVKPELRIGGIKVAEGTAMQAAISSPLNVYYTAAGEDTVDFDHTIITGSYNAIGITVGKVRPEYLSIAEVEKSDDAYLAKLLHSIAMGYHDRGNQTTQLLNDTMKMKGMTSFAEALVTTMEDRKMSIWDIPTDFEFNGFTIDAKDMTKAALPIDGGVYQKKMLDYAMVHGHEDSYQENRVFEDNLFWISGLSAVKGLQYLNAMGINIIELEPNQTYVNPNLPDAMVTSINNALNMGWKVIAPEETGSLPAIPYIKYDPNTGAAGFMIVTLAGGYGSPIYFNDFADPSLNPMELLFALDDYKVFYQLVSPEDGFLVAMGDSFVFDFNIISQVMYYNASHIRGLGEKIDTDASHYTPPMITPLYALKAGWHSFMYDAIKLLNFFVWGINIDTEGSDKYLGISQDGTVSPSNGAIIKWKVELKDNQKVDNVTLKIKDSEGVVKTMTGLQAVSQITWDGSKDGGGTIQPGIYSVSLSAISGGKTTESKTVLKITVFTVKITAPTNDQTFYIDKTPAMPTINAEAKLIDTTAQATYSWSLILQDTDHPVCKDINLSGTGKNWTPDFGITIMGGSYQIKVTANVNNISMNNNVSGGIGGENPDLSDVKNYSTGYGQGSFAKDEIACKIAVQESGGYCSQKLGCQFDESDGSVITSTSGAVGIMQIISGRTCAQTWNWKENLKQGFKLLEEKRSIAKNHHTTEKNVKYNPQLMKCIKDNQVSNPSFDFTPPPLSGSVYDGNTQLGRESIRAYNGGREYMWVNIDPKTCNGRWDDSEPQIPDGGDPDFISNVLGKTCP